MQKNKNKERAAGASEITYSGTCKKHGVVERYVSNSNCVLCSTEKHLIRMERILKDEVLHKDFRSKANKRNKETRKNNPQKIREADSKYRKANPARYLLHSSRFRAKKLKLKHNIDIDDIIIPEVCPILNIPLYCGKGTLRAGSPSLDRIDNTKGYIKGNIQVISHKANTCKNSLTPEELIIFSNWIASTFGNK